LFCVVQGKAGLFRNGVENLDGFRDYFGADAVAGQQRDIVCFGHVLSFV
jgi:hypothetical protein